MNAKQMEGIIGKAKEFFSSKVGVTLLAGVCVSILLPAILTQCTWGLDFTETGQIGDTIGGITTPVLTITGLIIVYYSFQQQLDANNKQWRAFEMELNKSRQEEQFADIDNAILILSEDINHHESTFRAIAQLIDELDSWEAKLIINSFSADSIAYGWGGADITNAEDLWNMFRKFDWFANYYESEWFNILEDIKESLLTESRKRLLQVRLRNKCVLPTYNWLSEETLKKLWELNEIRFQEVRISTVINSIRIGTPNAFPFAISPIKS